MPVFVSARLASVQLPPPSRDTAVHARYFEALVYFREESWAEAEKRFFHLVDRFPEAVNAPEALYHVGICRDHLGNRTGAFTAWEETIHRFPDTNWGRYARQRLQERGWQG